MIRAPGQPSAGFGSWHERDRWEWRWAPRAGDPFGDLERFLVDAGLPVEDLTKPATTRSDRGAVVMIGGGWPVSSVGGAPTPCPEVPDIAVVLVEGGPPAGDEPDAAVVGEWRASWGRADHAAAVEEVRQAIARGDVYQVTVVGHAAAPFTGDPAAVGARLAAVPGAPWAGGISGQGWAVHAASPELFVEVRHDVVTTRPIKGTSARGVDAGTDLAAYDALRLSEKDRAEHVMIVDLERNDLARVARTGGVAVDELYVVRPLAGLWHAESSVTAQLRPGVGLAELLSATFPGGSVTGTPKGAALSEIARREPVGRGPSMGALGWIGSDGAVRLGLSIRTVAAAADHVHLWAGGGVTWSSNPEDEVAEAAAKAAPLLAALAGPPR